MKILEIKFSKVRPFDFLNLVIAYVVGYLAMIFVGHYYLAMSTYFSALLTSLAFNYFYLSGNRLNWKENKKQTIQFSLLMVVIFMAISYVCHKYVDTLYFWKYY